MSSKNACKFLFYIVFSGSLLASDKVSAQEVFNSFITINKLRLADPVWVDFYKQSDPQNAVQIQPVLTSLSEVLSKALIFNITEKLDSEGKITFAQLRKLGIKAFVDISTLDISFEVEKEDKRKTKLEVSNLRKTDRKELIGPDFVSGYINFRTAHEFRGDNREVNQPDPDAVPTSDFDQVNSFSVEKVLNIGGVAFETQYIFSDTVVGDTEKVNRLYTRLTLDDEVRAIRYRLGDVTHSIRGFQDTVVGAGVSVQKEFTIKPQLFRSSFKRYNFYLETDSIVEVFVNGNLIKRKNLPQGPVELLDFPFNAGENEVRVRVTDRVGNIRNLNFSDINDSRLLAKGISDFSFNLVLPRSGDTLDVSLGNSYESDQTTLTGFYHRGIKKNFVAGVDFQYNKDRAILGLESLTGDQFGLLKLNLAGSQDRSLDKTGLGLRVEHESLLLKKGVLTNFRLFSSGEYRSRDFTNFIAEPTNLEYRLRATVGQNFKNSIRASLGAAKEWFHDDQESRTFINSTFGWTFYKNFDLSSNIRVNLENGDDTTVLFSLNWQSRTSNQQLTSTFDPVSNVSNAELAAYPLEGRQNFRTFVGAENTDSAERARLGFDYFSQRFEARLAHTSSFLERDESLHSTRLNLGFGFAYTDSSLALTRPIENSFALISMVGRPSGFSVPINKGINSQRGEINGWGPASLTNLAPYYSDRAKLDITALPYGYSLAKESFNFKSRYRSGTHINVVVDGEVSISGRAVYSNGQPAEYVTGHVYRYVNGKRGSLIQQVFTGGNGEFSIEKVEKQNYIISFESEDDVYADVVVSVLKSIGVFELKKDLVLIKQRRLR